MCCVALFSQMENTQFLNFDLSLFPTHFQQPNGVSFGFLLFPISLLSPYNLLTGNSIKKIYNLAHCFPLFLSVTTSFTQKFFNICVICISKRVFLIIGTVSIVPFSHLLYYIDNVFIFVFFGTVFIVPFSHLLYYIDSAFISVLFGTVSIVPSINICINVSLVLLYKLHCILSEKRILVLQERMKVKILRILFMTLCFVIWFSHIE